MEFRGKKCLGDKALVFVYLGSMDMRRNSDAVSLDRGPLTEAHHAQVDPALSVVVSASGAQGETTVVDLPVL